MEARRLRTQTSRTRAESKAWALAITSVLRRQMLFALHSDGDSSLGLNFVSACILCWFYLFDHIDSGTVAAGEFVVVGGITRLSLWLFGGTSRLASFRL